MVPRVVLMDRPVSRPYASNAASTPSAMTASDTFHSLEVRALATGYSTPCVEERALYADFQLLHAIVVFLHRDWCVVNWQVEATYTQLLQTDLLAADRFAGKSAECHASLNQ